MKRWLAAAVTAGDSVDGGARSLGVHLEGPFLNPAWQAYPLSSLAVTHAAAARPLCRIVSAFNPVAVTSFGEEPTERWCRQSRSYSGGRLA